MDRFTVETPADPARNLEAIETGAEARVFRDGDEQAPAQMGAQLFALAALGNATNQHRRTA